MTRFILSFLVLLGTPGPAAPADCDTGTDADPTGATCEWHNRIVTDIYLVGETVFWFKHSGNSTNWYIVDASLVGATNFDRIYDQLTTSMVKSCTTWFSYWDTAQGDLSRKLNQVSLKNACSYH